MKNAPAPICGISHALPNTDMAPHTPPIHIHHGFPLQKALRTQPIFLFPMQTAAMTTVAIRNDTVDACTAEPRQMPSLPYIAPMDAIRQPATMPVSCQSRIWLLAAVCAAFPFLRLGTRPAQLRLSAEAWQGREWAKARCVPNRTVRSGQSQG